MKKTLLTLIILGFSFLLIAGCGKSGSSSATNNGKPVLYSLSLSSNITPAPVFGMLKTDTGSGSLGMQNATFLKGVAVTGSLYNTYDTGSFKLCVFGYTTATNGNLFFEATNPAVQSANISGSLCVLSVDGKNLIQSFRYNPESLTYMPVNLNATQIAIQPVTTVNSQIATMQTESSALYSARVYFSPYLNIISDKSLVPSTTIMLPSELQGQSYGGVLAKLYAGNQVNLGTYNGITLLITPTFNSGDASNMSFTLNAKASIANLSMTNCHSLANYANINDSTNPNYYFVMDKVCQGSQTLPLVGAITLKMLGGGTIKPQVITVTQGVESNGMVQLTATVPAAVTAGSVQVNFTSGTTSVASNPASCTIAQDRTSCTTNLISSGTGGNTTVTAAATNILPGSTTVNFAPATLTLTAESSIVITGGNTLLTATVTNFATPLNVNFTSSVESIAANPAPCTINQGSNSCSTQLTGKDGGLGSTTVTAATNNFESSTTVTFTP